jgi:hypothetical protein
MAYANPYYIDQLASYRKPPTDPASLGVNIGKPSIPNMPGQPNNAPQMKQGFGLEQVIGGLTGAADIFSSANQMANQSLGLNPQLQGQYNQFEQPSYGLGQDYNQAALAKPQGASGGEVLGMAGKGAAAGSAFGPIGTGVGAVVGAGAALIGGRRRKKKQQKEKTAAQNTLKAGQQAFNQASADFSAQQNAAEDYQDRMNSQTRMYNLYGTR